MDHVPDARTGGDGGEECLDVFFGGDDGLAEIEGDEGRERGGLAGVGSGFDLLGEARGGELPEGGGAVGLGHGQSAEVLPEFGEGAKDGGLGDLFAELGGEVVGAHAGSVVFGTLGEEGVGVEGERGDLGGAAGGGGLLPGFVATEGEDVGEGEGRDDEVGGLAAGAGGRAEEVEGNGSAVEDEA